MLIVVLLIQPPRLFVLLLVVLQLIIVVTVAGVFPIPVILPHFVVIILFAPLSIVVLVVLSTPSI